MKKIRQNPKDVSSEFERLITAPDQEVYQLKLYVSGITPRSVRAINNIKKICEESLKGRYNLEIIDLYQNPNMAKTAQIVVAPTLIKRLPLPLRRLIGDLSDTDRILVGLDIRKV